MTQLDTVMVVTVHLSKRRIEFRANLSGTVHKLETLVMRRKLGLPFCLDTDYPRSAILQHVGYYGVLGSQIGFWDLQFVF